METEEGFAASYDAIIMPGSYDAGEIKVLFTVNDEPYTWALDAETFAPGNEYIYAVTLTRTGVQITGTINSWIPNSKEPGTAE